MQKEGRVREIVGRIEAQHGSILEHNRITWHVEADEEEVLTLLLRNRFFTVTRLGLKNWLMSSNLRAILEYYTEWGDVGTQLIETIKEVSPTIYKFMSSAKHES
jgi:hypothetical protein